VKSFENENPVRGAVFERRGKEKVLEEELEILEKLELTLKENATLLPPLVTSLLGSLLIFEENPVQGGAIAEDAELEKEKLLSVEEELNIFENLESLKENAKPFPALVASLSRSLLPFENENPEVDGRPVRRLPRTPRSLAIGFRFGVTSATEYPIEMNHCIS